MSRAIFALLAPHSLGGSAKMQRRQKLHLFEDEAGGNGANEVAGASRNKERIVHHFRDHEGAEGEAEGDRVLIRSRQLGEIALAVDHQNDRPQRPNLQNG